MEGYRSFSLSTCSPHSSEGGASYRSTPETKLTAFSPEDLRGEPKAIANSGIKIKLPPAFTLHAASNKVDFVGRVTGPASTEIHDPFTTTRNTLQYATASIARPKLSPTAISFTPSLDVEQPRSLKGSRCFHESLPPGQRLGTSAVSYLNATSVPDTAPLDLKLGNGSLVATPEAFLSPIGPLASTSTGIATLENESSKALGNSRYLMISNILKNVSIAELNEIFTVSTFLHSLLFTYSLQAQEIAIPIVIVTTDLAMMGTIYVKYNDLREAMNTFHKLYYSHKEWIIQYIGAKQFILKHQPQNFLYTSEQEGQVTVRAFYHGQRQNFDICITQELIKGLLHNFGSFFSFAIVSCEFPALVCRVEYFDTTAANLAITQLGELKVPVGENRVS